MVKSLFGRNKNDLTSELPSRDEMKLIDGLRSGEDFAYRKLYDMHYTVLCHVAFNYLKDDFLARSIVDETIFHFWEIRESVQIKTSLRIYLISAVRNRCLNYIRKMTSDMSKCVYSPICTKIIERINDDAHPLGRLLEHELENQIMEAVEQLPECTKNVFVLSRFDNKKYSEIADILDISVNTVKYHISQALNILSDKLEKYL